MVFSGSSNASPAQPSVSGHKISTVVPATVTGEGVEYELSNVDLAMKLHYVQGVYYFEASSTLAGLSTGTLKAPMFLLLNSYHQAAARIRTSGEGRPFLKCNDSGLRIVEASCDADLASWLHQAKEISRSRALLPEHAIGPHIQFSPLVFIQFTRFRCGGLAVGFSWSHILGDVASASAFLNRWGEILVDMPTTMPQDVPAASNKVAKEKTISTTKVPLSIKQVHPIEDYWIAPTDQKMETYTFHIADPDLRLIESKSNAGTFESISALIWHYLASIRYGREPRVVTICRGSPTAQSGGQLSNRQIISTVDVNSSYPPDVELSELARLITEEAQEENNAIEGQIDGETGTPDFIVYGANLTFVNMEEIHCCGLELKNQKPILVEYTIGGVGDEGAVLVQQGVGDDGEHHRERAVHVILPEAEIRGLRQELASVWGIA